MIIKDAAYIISAVKPSQYPSESYPEFIFMGRSNVGKSSFINALTGRKNLAYTSSKPGKTLTLNFYLINSNIYFIDVPGYGYAKKGFDNRMEFGKMIEGYLASKRNLKMIFLLVDSKVGPTEDDKLMYDYLIYHHEPVTIISTKYDKLNQSEKATIKKLILERLEGTSPANIHFISAQTGFGIDEVQNLIETLNQGVNHES